MWYNARMSTKSVVVFMKLSSKSGREKFAGLCDYVDEHTDWDVTLVPEFALCNLRQVRRQLDAADGVIFSDYDPRKALARLAVPDLPIVFVDHIPAGFRADPLRRVFVCNDACSIARAAIKHFRDQRAYVSYAYVPAGGDSTWSAARERAFRNELAKLSVACEVFREKSEAALRQFLARLPKPCALLAANDERARDVLRAAKDAGVAVPQQVAVLGIDDFRFICENARPTLSSILPDFVASGRVAAEALGRMMAGQPAGGGNGVIAVPVREVLTRASTSARTTGETLVRKAQAWIRRHAFENPPVSAIAARIGVSPSLLTLRFNELCGETPGSMVARLRLEEVRRRLAHTTDGYDDIAAACGFENVNALRNLFRRRFGMTMSDFRSQKSGKHFPRRSQTTRKV